MKKMLFEAFDICAGGGRADYWKDTLTATDVQNRNWLYASGGGANARLKGYAAVLKYHGRTSRFNGGIAVNGMSCDGDDHRLIKSVIEAAGITDVDALLQLGYEIKGSKYHRKTGATLAPIVSEIKKRLGANAAPTPKEHMALALYALNNLYDMGNYPASKLTTRPLEGVELYVYSSGATGSKTKEWFKVTHKSDQGQAWHIAPYGNDTGDILGAKHGAGGKVFSERMAEAFNSQFDDFLKTITTQRNDDLKDILASGGSFESGCLARIKTEYPDVGSIKSAISSTGGTPSSEDHDTLVKQYYSSNTKESTPPGNASVPAVCQDLYDAAVKGADLPYQQDPSEPVENCYNHFEIQSQSWIICPTMANVAGFGDGIYSQLEKLFAVDVSMFTLSNPNSAPVYNLWNTLRSLSNIGFSIFLLLIIFSQITGFGVNNYGVKKMLPKLIISAVLVNLSWIIAVIAVDISNILGQQLYGLIINLSGGADVIKNDTSNIFVAILGVLGLGGAGVVGLAVPIISTLAAGGGIAAVFTLLMILIPALIAVLVFFLTVAIRQLIIILCVIVSPIAFLLYSFPNTNSIFKKYIKLFQTSLIIYPVCSALYGLAKVIQYLSRDITGDSGWSIAIVAAIAPFIPFAVAPSLVTKSVSALGNAGAQLSKLGGTLGKTATGGLDKWRNSDKMKSKQEIGAGNYAMWRAGRKADRTAARQERGKKSLGDRYRGYREDKNREKLENFQDNENLLLLSNEDRTRAAILKQASQKKIDEQNAATHILYQSRTGAAEATTDVSQSGLSESEINAYLDREGKDGGVGYDEAKKRNDTKSMAKYIAEAKTKAFEAAYSKANSPAEQDKLSREFALFAEHSAMLYGDDTTEGIADALRAISSEKGIEQGFAKNLQDKVFRSAQTAQKTMAEKQMPTFSALSAVANTAGNIDQQKDDNGNLSGAFNNTENLTFMKNGALGMASMNSDSRMKLLDRQPASQAEAMTMTFLTSPDEKIRAAREKMFDGSPVKAGQMLEHAGVGTITNPEARSFVLEQALKDVSDSSQRASMLDRYGYQENEGKLTQKSDADLSDAQRKAQDNLFRSAAFNLVTQNGASVSPDEIKSMTTDKLNEEIMRHVSPPPPTE